MSHSFSLLNAVSSGYNYNLSWSKNFPFQLLGLCQIVLRQQLNESHAEISYFNSVNCSGLNNEFSTGNKETRLNMISFTLREMLSFIKDIKMTMRIFAGK